MHAKPRRPWVVGSRPARWETRRRPGRSATSSSTPSTTRSHSPARNRPCCRSSARTSKGRRSASTTSSSRRSTRCSGLKFKNTSGAHLNQGPITVFEGSVYAGDTRVLDVQPNEERLVSLRHRPRHRSRSASRPRHAEDHEREGREGNRHHRDQGDRGEEVPDHQPQSDGSHSVDRAPEPHESAVQARRYRQADGGHARRLPLPDAGEGRRDQDLHGEGGEGHLQHHRALEQPRRTRFATSSTWPKRARRSSRSSTRRSRSRASGIPPNAN